MKTVLPVNPVQSRETLPELPQKARKVLDNKASSSGTQVKLSLSQAELMQSSPRDINETRVKALKQAIRNGELKMDTGKIADALLQETQEYLKGQHDN